MSNKLSNKIAMTFCIARNPMSWIVGSFGARLARLQDYVGLLESIPQQYAQEQLLTPGSLSQVGAPDMRLQWAAAAIHPWQG